MYFGKSITEQRRIVFKRAGFSQSMISQVVEIDRSWPEEIRYDASGAHNVLSYVKYLLIPRIPSGSNRYSLEVKGEKLKWSKTGEIITDGSFRKTKTSIVGFLLSLLSISGIAQLIVISFPNMESFPEAVGLSVLFVTVVTLFAQGLVCSIRPAFIIFLFMGIIGWFFLGAKKISKKNNCQEGGISGNNSSYRKTIPKDTGLFIKTCVYFLFGLLFLVIFWSFIMSVIVVPDDWDAWAIWGAKAKVLALGNGPLSNVSFFGHSDYPLLWPVTWAFSGWCSGGWEEHFSRGWGTVFLSLTAWELYRIVIKETHEAIIGLLTAAFFVSIPMVSLVASWSYAESPLWLMITCGTAALLRWREEGEKRDIVLAGLFAAAAALTKNEGVLFALLLGAWFFALPKKHIVSTLLFFAIFLTVYMPWWYWAHINNSFTDHAIAGLQLSTDGLLRALGRLPDALQSIKKMWLDIRQWNIVLWGLGLGWLYLLVSKKTRYRISLLFPFLLLFGYLVVILYHTDDVTWQIGTSWNRLTVQAVPLFLVTVIPEFWHRLKNS